MNPLTAHHHPRQPLTLIHTRPVSTFHISLGTLSQKIIRKLGTKNDYLGKGNFPPYDTESP